MFLSLVHYLGCSCAPPGVMKDTGKPYLLVLDIHLRAQFAVLFNQHWDKVNANWRATCTNRAGQQKGRMLSPPETLVGAFQILSHLISLRFVSSLLILVLRVIIEPKLPLLTLCITYFWILLASNKHHSHVNKNHCLVSERPCWSSSAGTGLLCVTALHRLFLELRLNGGWIFLIQNSWDQKCLGFQTSILCFEMLFGYAIIFGIGLKFKHEMCVS